MLFLLSAVMRFMSSIEAVILLELLSDTTFSKNCNIFTVLDVRLFLRLRVIQWLTYRTIGADRSLVLEGSVRRLQNRIVLRFKTERRETLL
jgi:hypothetical protein